MFYLSGWFYSDTFLKEMISVNCVKTLFCWLLDMADQKVQAPACSTDNLPNMEKVSCVMCVWAEQGLEITPSVFPIPLWDSPRESCRLKKHRHYHYMERKKKTKKKKTSRQKPFEIPGATLQDKPDNSVSVLCWGSHTARGQCPWRGWA